MKRVLTLILAALMAFGMSGCGKEQAKKKSQIVDGAPYVSTPRPEVEDDEPTPSPTAASDSASDAKPTKKPTTVRSASTGGGVSYDEIYGINEESSNNALMSRQAFDERPVANGKHRYIGANDSWGIDLPNNVVIGDEDESGVLFMIGNALLTIQVMDSPVELHSPDDAKAFLGDNNLEIQGFTIIKADGRYAGSRFYRVTAQANAGYNRILTNGQISVAASVMNPSGYVPTELLEAADALAIFE